MDELARAYATLGIAPGASVDALRKKYKALVRKWHPDRHAADPQGQAEANLRMRDINDAFRRVVAARASRSGDFRAAPAADEPANGPAYVRREPEFGRRLTREEIDRIVEAMKGEGPLDWILDATPDVDPDAGRKLRAGFCALVAALVPALFAEAFFPVSDDAFFASLVVVPLAAYAFFLRVLPPGSRDSRRSD